MEWTDVRVDVAPDIWVTATMLKPLRRGGLKFS